LEQLPNNPEYDPAIRKAGAGRKGYEEHHPNIDEQFLDVLKDHTAGDPMDEKVVWTDLTPDEISKFLEQKHQVKVSKTIIKKLWVFGISRGAAIYGGAFRQNRTIAPKSRPTYGGCHAKSQRAEVIQETRLSP
jgi:hypothetical protein